MYKPPLYLRFNYYELQRIKEKKITPQPEGTFWEQINIDYFKAIHLYFYLPQIPANYFILYFSYTFIDDRLMKTKDELCRNFVSSNPWLSDKPEENKSY